MIKNIKYENYEALKNYIPLIKIYRYYELNDRIEIVIDDGFVDDVCNFKNINKIIKNIKQVPEYKEYDDFIKNREAILYNLNNREITEIDKDNIINSYIEYGYMSLLKKSARIESMRLMVKVLRAYTMSIIENENLKNELENYFN